MDTVRQFYRDAFYNLREVSDTPIVLHDGFADPSWMNGFLTPYDNNAQGVIVDYHQYQIFGDGLAALSVEEHLGMACNAVSGPLPVSSCFSLLTIRHRSTTTPHPTNGPLSVSGPVH